MIYNVIVYDFFLFEILFLFLNEPYIEQKIKW